MRSTRNEDDFVPLEGITGRLQRTIREEANSCTNCGEKSFKVSVKDNGELYPRYAIGCRICNYLGEPGRTIELAIKLWNRGRNPIVKALRALGIPVED